ncbi:cytochrome c [Pseudoruegeria sp. SK021]|uniref:c-type cytochrome n=1 Tax=Pseudoruegeria sp. SK021 TaxID=1933035 RepID=UPI000A262219|nr:cytochrome c [Pseudoruegeria sp. SK021]OSP54546.1 hypothetical protein BV911_11810 [Pseudoruegeria sp. SK021]
MKFACLTSTIASLAIICIGASASAQEALTDKQLASAVAARQAHMDLNGFNLGILGAMAKTEVPYDAAVASAAADNLVALATGINQSAYWVEGSAAGSVEGSRALPAIWEDMAAFEAVEAKFAEATLAMQPAAGESLEALQAQMGVVGQTCNECHKTFRQSR